ncbi:MAG: hypothetical protein ACRDZR_10885, partial [Acidimicrobiales bacterium]
MTGIRPKDWRPMRRRQGRDLCLGELATDGRRRDAGDLISIYETETVLGRYRYSVEQIKLWDLKHV